MCRGRPDRAGRRSEALLAHSACRAPDTCRPRAGSSACAAVGRFSLRDQEAPAIPAPGRPRLLPPARRCGRAGERSPLDVASEVSHASPESGVMGPTPSLSFQHGPRSGAGVSDGGRRLRGQALSCPAAGYAVTSLGRGDQPGITVAPAVRHCATGSGRDGAEKVAGAGAGGRGGSPMLATHSGGHLRLTVAGAVDAPRAGPRRRISGVLAMQIALRAQRGVRMRSFLPLTLGGGFPPSASSRGWENTFCQNRHLADAGNWQRMVRGGPGGVRHAQEKHSSPVAW